MTSTITSGNEDAWGSGGLKGTTNLRGLDDRVTLGLEFTNGARPCLIRQSMGKTDMYIGQPALYSAAVVVLDAGQLLQEDRSGTASSWTMSMIRRDGGRVKIMACGALFLC